MSGMLSPLASGVPNRNRMLLLPHPEAPYWSSTPFAELTAAAREVRSTPLPEAAGLPVRSRSRLETSVR